MVAGLGKWPFVLTDLDADAVASKVSRMCFSALPKATPAPPWKSKDHTAAFRAGHNLREWFRLARRDRIFSFQRVANAKVANPANPQQRGEQGGNCKISRISISKAPQRRFAKVSTQTALAAMAGTAAARIATSSC